MAMRFEYMRSGDYAGRAVWEGEVRGWPVALLVSGYTPSRSLALDRREWADLDQMVEETESAGGWYVAACNVVGDHGLCSVASSEFQDWNECVSYLEDVLDRVEEGEFDALLGREGDRVD